MDGSRDHFEQDTLVNQVMLKKQYFRMEKKEGSSVEAHIKKMKELKDRLVAIKALIPAEGSSCYSLGNSTS